MCFRKSGYADDDEKLAARRRVRPRSPIETGSKYHLHHRAQTNESQSQAAVASATDATTTGQQQAQQQQHAYGGTHHSHGYHHDGVHVSGGFDVGSTGHHDGGGGA